LPGIRDKNALCSAIDAPKASMFGQEVYPCVYSKASVYLYHIICNHAFNDANKRTAHASAMVFLFANKAKINFKNEELENLVIEVAKGNVSKEIITGFLKGSLVTSNLSEND
jgi:death-on-curing protein